MARPTSWACLLSHCHRLPSSLCGCHTDLLVPQTSLVLCHLEACVSTVSLASHCASSLLPPAHTSFYPFSFPSIRAQLKCHLLRGLTRGRRDAIQMLTCPRNLFSWHLPYTFEVIYLFGSLFTCNLTHIDGAPTMCPILLHSTFSWPRSPAHKGSLSDGLSALPLALVRPGPAQPVDSKADYDCDSGDSLPAYTCPGLAVRSVEWVDRAWAGCLKAEF